MLMWRPGSSPLRAHSPTCLEAYVAGDLSSSPHRLLQEVCLLSLAASSQHDSWMQAWRCEHGVKRSQIPRLTPPQRTRGIPPVPASGWGNLKNLPGSRRVKEMLPLEGKCYDGEGNCGIRNTAVPFGGNIICHRIVSCSLLNYGQWHINKLFLFLYRIYAQFFSLYATVHFKY